MDVSGDNSKISLFRLPESTVKLLTSGQVITSVSTAVKELIENAIDAGATNVEIKLDNEGFDKIEVKDNGSGIRLDDVAFMCQRRYTSKIKDFGDLEHLSSYGFRGEALNSLCAVAQLTVITKTCSDPVAHCYTFNSEGTIISCKPSHLTTGTVIIVQGLFKNLPVRKQYLSNGRRKSQELKSVGDIVKSFGLIHPKLRITLTHNKYLIWQKSAVSNIRESLVQVVPTSVVKYLHEIDYSEDNLKIQLMIPSKDCYVWNTCYGISINATNLFVNSRPVKNKKIEKAVQEQINQFFGSTIPKMKTPFCVIAISIPSNRVDVNLEPNKTKVIIKEIDYLIKVIVNEIIKYYFGVLEPPKPSVNDDAVSENSLKRKSVECTPTKTKFPRQIESNSNITHNDGNSESYNTSNENCLIDNSSPSINISSNTCNTQVVETDSTHGLEEVSCNEVETSLLNTDEEMEKSILCLKNVTVTIEESPTDQAVGFMSSEDSSSDSLIEEIMLKINEDTEVPSINGNDILKTSTQKEPNEECETHSSNNLQSGLDMENITLSQWSKGKIELNGKVVESSTVVGKKELINHLERKSDSSESNISSQDKPLERSISSQMGCKEMSAFTKFAKEMRSKIIEQTPGITFTAVAAELASKWRNLHEDEKKVFADKVKEDKVRSTRYSLKMKDPPYKPKPKSLRYNPPSANKGRNYSISKSVDISVDDIKSTLEKRTNYKKSDLSIITTLEEKLVLLDDKDSIVAASIDRLKEAVSFYDHLEKVEIKCRLLDKRLPILQSDLDPELRNVLDSLETSFDDLFNTIIIICDERITKNGFRVEKIPGTQEHQYFITDVPHLNEMFSGLDELKEILLFISINKSVKLRNCRPAKVVNFIRNEIMKSELEINANMTNHSTLIDLYRFWSENLKKLSRNCPHFHPVSKKLFPLDKNFVNDLT